MDIYSLLKESNNYNNNTFQFITHYVKDCVSSVELKTNIVCIINESPFEFTIS
jgi:hypothetical protein